MSDYQTWSCDVHVHVFSVGVGRFWIRSGFHGQAKRSHLAEGSPICISTDCEGDKRPDIGDVLAKLLRHEQNLRRLTNSRW